MVDISNSMGVDKTLSANTMHSAGDTFEAMTRIPVQVSCQEPYSSKDNQFHSECEKKPEEINISSRIPKSSKAAIIYSRQKCPSKLQSATKPCEISSQQLVTLTNQSNRSCFRQVTKGLLADQNNSINCRCDGKQNNNNTEHEEEVEMSSIYQVKRKRRQNKSSTIWNYDNCYHTCSFQNNINQNNNINNIEYGNGGGQNEKRSHCSNNTESSTTTTLRSNECSTQTKTIVHSNVTSNFVSIMAMKNLLLLPFYFLSVSVMNNKLFVKSPSLILLSIYMLLSCATVLGNPVASAGPGPLGVGSGSSLQQGGGLLPFPEGKKLFTYCNEIFSSRIGLIESMKSLGWLITIYTHKQESNYFSTFRHRLLIVYLFLIIA